MLNRNSKKLPKEDILSIKKTGKRLRNGYALTKLKRWKKEYAERKLRSTTKAEEPKKTYAMNTERLKRAKQTIARRKRSKSMEERRQYWMKKNKNVESVGSKRKSTSKSTKKKVVTRERAMPTKQDISKAKSGVKKNRSVESVDRKVKSTSKKEVTRERAMPTKNRAMVNKQIVEKIKSVEQKAPVVELPIEAPVVELPIETPSELTTIKEIAKESEDKIVVPSLPKFTEEKIENFNKVQEAIEKVKGDNTNDGYKIIENIVYNGNGLGNEAVNKFFKYLDNYQTYSYTKFDDVIHIVEKYRDEEEVAEDESDSLILILICWFLYQKIIRSPKSINDIFKKIKGKNNLSDILTIPIFANNKQIISDKKGYQPDNLNYKTLWALTEKVRSKESHQKSVLGTLYSDKNDVVNSNGYALLIMSKNWLNSETKNKLKENTKYNEDLSVVENNYVTYKNVLPDESTTINTDCSVKEEIEKCKLVIKLSKYVKNINVTRIIGKDDSDYIGITYSPVVMLPILEIYEKLGITSITLKVQKDFSDNNSTKINNIRFTKKAIIIEPANPKHYIYSLIMPIRAETIDTMDISYNNKYGRQYFNSIQESKGLSDHLNYSSEVQEIANDVPAFGDLFSDIDYSSEVQEIANDVPAFGDHITEEKIELDTEYDLPDVLITRDDSKIASSKDIRAMKFKQIMLPSKYKALLGKVPENFRLLLWGAPGHGKSSLALTIANDIGKRVKTLYVSAEESLESATLSSRIKRFKATSRNLMFNDTNNPEIIEKIIMTFNPKFIVIDSVNVILGKTEAIINLMLKYPSIGFIIIAQATKDRKRYAGLGSLAHAVDIVVNVKDGIATAEKNRYAQLGSMVVKGIKI